MADLTQTLRFFLPQTLMRLGMGRVPRADAVGPSPDRLSAERLRDLGLPARSEANRRCSWEQGQVPRSDLW